ncbi:MAG TPA: nucleoside triphosphate pyrophosphohydrolase [Patescibacteria group bacterium]|nr:nucleoside triphosphate pyrophosphohydrolase [Patescibacteria group bacterium]
MTQEYNKLVRDNIPDVIKKDHKTSGFHVADEVEYEQKLSEKLKEEVEEFLAEFSPEELADVLEVIYTITDLKNIDLEKVEEIRLNKNQKRGSFKKRIILDVINDQSSDIG